MAAVREYATVEQILQSAADRGEAPLLVVCDEISDPTTWARSCVPPSVPGPMGSSFPSGAARG